MHVNNILGMIKYIIGYTSHVHIANICKSRAKTHHALSTAERWWKRICSFWGLHPSMGSLRTNSNTSTNHLILSAGMLSCLCDLVFSVPSAGPLFNREPMSKTMVFRTLKLIKHETSTPDEHGAMLPLSPRRWSLNLRTLGPSRPGAARDIRFCRKKMLASDDGNNHQSCWQEEEYDTNNI